MNVLRTKSMSILRRTGKQLNPSHRMVGRALLSKRGYRNRAMIYRSHKHHSILSQLSILPNYCQSQCRNKMASLATTSTAATTMATIASNHQNNTSSTISQRNHSKSQRGQRAPTQYGLCFLGAPGVGKGTYSKRIASHFSAKILSSGDLIRECAKANEGTELGQQLDDCIKQGKLVPDDVVIPMVVAYLRMLQESFILDGFPRTLNQARRIHSEYKLHCVAYFKLPDHVLIGKMLGRRICTTCGTNFNVTTIKEGEIDMPSMAPIKEGICDNCGDELTMRPDDTQETISERLKIYHSETGPIEAFYKDAGLLMEYKIQKGIGDIPDILQKLDDFVTNYEEREELEKQKYYASDTHSIGIRHNIHGFNPTFA